MKNTEFTIKHIAYTEIAGTDNLEVVVDVNNREFEVLFNLEEREDGTYRIADCGDSTDLYGSFNTNTEIAEYFESNNVVDNREKILETIKEYIKVDIKDI